jgi:2-polyprenyl-3-methyl-5-hydroxy-6-metoxy-1,4-benzoquinol methylase
MSNPASQPDPNGVDPQPRTGDHVCPWWAAYILASPLRRLVDNPEKLLAPYVNPGMTVVDLGCSMGFFSIPLARMVGATGRVVSVDVQERALRVLRKRAQRKGLDQTVETRHCTQEDLGLDDVCGRVDVAVAFHVVHESRDAARFLADCFSVLRPGGKLILAEPVGHITDEDRAQIFALTTATGFSKLADLSMRRSQGAVFEKPGDAD